MCECACDIVIDSLSGIFFYLFANMNITQNKRPFSMFSYEFNYLKTFVCVSDERKQENLCIKSIHILHNNRPAAATKDMCT